ncbi:YdgA family protein [Pseudomonas purpurea]|uniref:YdgA family protein n=1 Tax=Pseudomonas purpurea TaxID=3136737 RepID=UPI003267B9D7
MNKSAGVLLGIVVAIGAISAGGAWYTGTKLEGVLQASIADANKELKEALIGSDGAMTVELVSLDRKLFSSTAHYRLKGQGAMFGEDPAGVELLFVDRIEHGPLPLSRLTSLKLMPVMATSHYELEKTPLTEKWFALTKDAAPLKGMVSIGYDRSTDGTLELLPLELGMEDTSTLKFSGLNVEISASAEAKNVKAKGYMDSLKLVANTEGQGPSEVELNGLTLVSNMTKGAYGSYMGDNTLELTSTRVALPEQKTLLIFKNSEIKTSSQESGTNGSGRAEYKMGEVAFNGKVIGGAQMAWSLKNLDLPATMSLVKIYQTKLQPYEKASTEAAEAGLPTPELKLTEAEQAQVKLDLQKLLAAKPQIAMENLSFNTPNGESRASLSVELTKPASMELPVDQLARQMISQLSVNLQVSKPMIIDLMTLQGEMEGQADLKAVADQATAASEMVSSMAVGTQLAKLEGNNIVSKLHYADNKVDFNGQKMTVEEFVAFVNSKAGGAGALQ